MLQAIRGFPQNDLTFLLGIPFDPARAGIRQSILGSDIPFLEPHFRMAFKIAVCIPCSSKDFKNIQYCLKSVAAQTRQPDYVIISFSEVSAKLQPVVDTSGFAFPIECLHESKQLYAGANRNRASERATALGADLLSFFDADDIMHPRRLERLEAHFQADPTLVGLVHHFLMGPNAEIDKYAGTVDLPWEPIWNDYVPNAFVSGVYKDFNMLKYCRVKKQRRGYGFCAPGHGTVLASFWKENPYVETLRIGEDGHFFAAILKQRKNLGYCGDTLSLYFHVKYKGIQVGF